MKKILVVAAYLLVSHVFAQPLVIAKKATQTYKALQQHHYAPRKLDDSLSNQVYQQFLTAINIDGLLFSKAEASLLSKHQFKIDEYIPAENTSFLTEASAFLQTHLQDYLQFLKSEENTAIVFPKEAYWPIGNAGTPENKELLKTQRVHFVLAEVLNRIMRSGKDFSEVNTTAPDLKKTFLNQEIKRIKNLQANLNAFIEDSFLNALCLVHDPHSSYLSATNFQRFKHSLSSQSLSFGLIFEEDWLGRIVIQNIIPGSSAQKSDSLFVGDQLIQVMFENGVSVDLASGDYLNDLEMLLDDPTIKTASFTVMSSGQITKIVKLTKTTIDLQENTVSAFLLKGPVTIGYMSLPSFYTQWKSDLFMSSANDVAKAIIKMKQENIQGLIVDLRNNGGGSVIEAIDLLGIFIDQGGLFQVKNKTEVSTVKDAIRGVIYDGPLVIMINRGSGSAAELVAATLQDHKRAILTGSTSYGKATIQTLFNLSDATPYSEGISEGNDVLKITCEKTYRATGASYQLKGVVPDIDLPDASTYLYQSEKDLPFALSNDSINRKTYYTPFVSKKPWKIPSPETIRQKELSDALANLKQVLSKGLMIKPEYFIRLQNVLKELESQASYETIYEVRGLQYDKSLTTFNAYNTILQQDIKNLQQSPYVYEVYKIIQHNLSTR
ncbi:MAG: hypothetical protein EBR30_10335 [Cytophagia bacterium]|nr:hypothetical protein [Cytophagia bacterium]NBW35395.1 hypothetical protein [Cytophagia bacterium]